MSAENSITIKINNKQNLAYKTILLRKFFCMVFFDASGRKLSIYIATVFGGLEAERDSIDAETCVYYGDPNCPLHFEISDNGCALIKSSKITDLTSSFYEQKDCINRVWGSCEECDERKAIEKLKAFYPSVHPKEEDLKIAADKILIFKQGDAITHRFVAVPGDFKKNSDLAYTLTGPKQGQRIAGVEAMNWVLTEVELTRPVLEKMLQIGIDFGTVNALTPDFTWYYAPPAGFVISEDSVMILGDKTEKNLIAGVADTTTVPFKEWVKHPNSINERKKSRFISKSVDNYSSELAKKKTIVASLLITNPHATNNRQFLLGLLVAFFLAFCADKTRINEYYQCLHKYCTMGDSCPCLTACNLISLFAPLLSIFTFLSLVMTPKRCIPDDYSQKRSKVIKLARIVGIALTAVAMVYTFVLWLIIPEFLSSFISCTTNLWIVGIGFIAPFLIHLGYLLICTLKFKRQIYNYL